MPRLLQSVSLGFILLLFSASKTDPFSQIKKELKNASCIRVEFLSIVESDVFSAVDTVAGSALLSSDGRYRIRLGPDWFVFDLTDLYSYNADQQQVTVQNQSKEESLASEVTFLTQLDDLYDSRILEPDKRFRLNKKDTSATSLPQSMVVTLDNARAQIAMVEYLDENEDTHTLMMKEIDTKVRCDSANFVADIPKGAELIRLDQ